ncbi:aminotransferase class I/II-fold pyridoxal phosphate-dependent enzyme [Streptomyces sp. NPDC048416]|uniref:aminotransferase class I/II-fold pyridoxal phosphate-dependent enzyme n=1 Tax=Streptomyces sp. NPDC048416 TaxID=3365546 RepID=UPI0037154825
MQSRETLLGVLEQAVRAVRGYREPTALDPSAELTELGLGSLQAMELLVIIEQQSGVQLPDTILHQVRTVGDLLDAMALTPEHAAQNGPVGRGEPERPALPEQSGGAAHARPSRPGLQAIVDLVDRAEVPSPYFAVHEGVPDATTVVNGARMAAFSASDYLGLAGDPYVLHAAKQAIDRYGTSVAASRAVSGERVIHRELENDLADFLGAQASLAFVSGHGTNVSVLSHLAGPGDLIVRDALAHNSLVQGSELSGARCRVFPHNDVAFLSRLLTAERGRYRRVVVVAEGVYSMDGDLADLPGLVELRERYDVLLYLDEAHSIGVLGASGAGAAEHFGVPSTDIDVRMGTFSKSLASCGGFVAGSAGLIGLVKQTAPGFIYSTGLAPSAAAAARAALRQLRERPQLAAVARGQAALFRHLAHRAGLDTGRSSDGSCVVPVVVRDAETALRLAALLADRGISVCPFVPPAVEADQSRLRFFVTARHTDAHITAAVSATAQSLDDLARGGMHTTSAALAQNPPGD